MRPGAGLSGCGLPQPPSACNLLQPRPRRALHPVPIVALFQGPIKSAISKSNQRQTTLNDFTLDVEITVPELTRLVLKDGAAAIVTGFGVGFETKVDFLGKFQRE